MEETLIEYAGFDNLDSIEDEKVKRNSSSR